MKICTRCLQEKPESAFQIRKASVDGLTASCKKCLAIYDKKRSNLPHRVKAREEYQASPVGRKVMNAAKARYIERNQVKRAAHVIFGNASRRGKIVRGPCEAPGPHRGRVEAHHDDYSKPLEVRWLCSKHHKEHHAKAS